MIRRIARSTAKRQYLVVRLLGGKDSARAPAQHGFGSENFTNPASGKILGGLGTNRGRPECDCVAAGRKVQDAGLGIPGRVPANISLFRGRSEICRSFSVCWSRTSEEYRTP